MHPNCEADGCRRRAVRSLLWRGADAEASWPVCQLHAAAAKRVWGDEVLIVFL